MKKSIEFERSKYLIQTINRYETITIVSLFFLICFGLLTLNCSYYSFALAIAALSFIYSFIKMKRLRKNLLFEIKRNSSIAELRILKALINSSKDII